MLFTKEGGVYGAGAGAAGELMSVTAALELQVLREKGRAIDRIGAAAEQDCFACSL